jgi:hypothetical protein
MDTRNKKSQTTLAGEAAKRSTPASHGAEQPSSRILVIPDAQVKPGVPTEHLEWAGKYLVDKRPDVVVCLGDFADMPSMSTHDKAGSKSFEGLRYRDDVVSTKEAMQTLLRPLRGLQAHQKKVKDKVYRPRMVMLMGNHENRINRAINNLPILEGTISTDDLEYEKDWEVHQFLHPVTIDGVVFNHYFPTGAMGRPASTASAMVSKLHQSCIAGHQQGRQVAYGRRADGSMVTCIIAGSFYLHDEDYMDVTSNKHWRGLVMLNEVNDGHFDESFISINFLRKKYATDLE